VQREFGLRNDKDLRIIHSDAIEWVRHNTIKFDLIVDDLFLDTDAVPQSLEGDYISDIGDILSEDGIYIKNTMFRDLNGHDSLREKLNGKFQLVEVLYIKSFGNRVFYCNKPYKSQKPYP
jgi:spermidine synthase